MARRLTRAGEGRLGCILWLSLTLIFVMIAWKVVPIRIKSSELSSYMEEQAKFAYRASPEALKKRVVAKTRELDLPVDPKKVIVERRGGRIVLKCTYTVPVEFPFYTYLWKFDLLVDRPVFMVELRPRPGPALA
ncbi:MAG: hypothetical protein WBH85_02700 [Thermoanaerobaculia bacterium]